MSDANRVQLSYIVEPSSAFGEKVSGSALQVLRYNSESLKQDMATTISEEIRHDRQISDIARIGVSASGGIDFELSYGSHDEFLKAALMAASWSTEVRVEGLTFSAAGIGEDNSFNDTDSRFGSFVADQWIYVSGFTNSANNGYFKIVSVTAAKLIVEGGTLETEAVNGDAREIIMGAYIINGTTAYSYNIEKDFKDLTQVLSLLKGMTINTMALEIPADGIIKGNFGFMGSEEESLIESAGSAHTVVGSTVVMTGANHVTDFLEDLSDTAILSLSFNLNNNLRSRLQVGTLGVASIGVGSVEITGSITLHLETAALFNKYLQQTPTSIVLAVQDSAGNGYIIELPRVKIIDGTRSAGGLNTDVIGDFEFRAYMDPDELVSIRIARFAPSVLAEFAGVCSAGSSASSAGLWHSRDEGATWPYGPSD